MEITLIFVYNADSGVLNAIKDYIHKETKPETYPCNLCALTFGNLGERKQWKEYVKGLEVPAEFYHKDELYKKYGKMDVKLPCMFVDKGGELELVINADEMNSIETLDALISTVDKKLRKMDHG